MGVRIPAAALEHQYMVTEPMKEKNPKLPTLRDPDLNFYLKPEVGGFAVGGWEMGTPSFHPNGVPFEFAQELLPPNMERFEEIALATAERIPKFGELGLKQLINGPIPVSPDGEPIMGKANERDNVFVACGFTSGIAAAGGAGRAMAEWILQGYPEMDLWSFDLRRFGDFHSGTRALHERAVHAYGSYYHLHYPGEELTVARDARRSPLWQILKERGAVYGSKFGWERPNWFGKISLTNPVSRASRTGSTPSPPSTRRPASASRCSISARSPSSRSRGRAPSNRCSAWRPTTSTSPTAA